MSRNNSQNKAEQVKSILKRIGDRIVKTKEKALKTLLNRLHIFDFVYIRYSYEIYLKDFNVTNLLLLMADAQGCIES